MQFNRLISQPTLCPYGTAPVDTRCCLLLAQYVSETWAWNGKTATGVMTNSVPLSKLIAEVTLEEDLAYVDRFGPLLFLNSQF